MAPPGLSCIPPGEHSYILLRNIKTAGGILILVGECLYTLLGNIKNLLEIPNLFRDDGRLTLLGE